MPNSLLSSYTFYSTKTRSTYFMTVFTQPLGPIAALGNPNCQGYLITSGNFIVVAEGKVPQSYTIPKYNQLICNGLFPNAATCPDGPGAPLCQGIDRLFVNFSQKSNNTMIVANDAQSITVVFDKGNTDIAKLIGCTFPPVAG